MKGKSVVPCDGGGVDCVVVFGGGSDGYGEGGLVVFLTWRKVEKIFPLDVEKGTLDQKLFFLCIYLPDYLFFRVSSNTHKDI